MLAYLEVPQWYYLTIGAVSFALGTVAILVWDTQLPVWALIVAILVALFYAVPIGMIEAITNVQVGLKYAFFLYLRCLTLTWIQLACSLSL